MKTSWNNDPPIMQQNADNADMLKRGKTVNNVGRGIANIRGLAPFLSE